MNKPDKIYYNWNKNKQVDSDGVEVGSDETTFQIALSVKKPINIQFVNDDGSAFDGITASAAMFLADNDYSNQPIYIPLSNDIWTNSSGSEYYCDLSGYTPAEVSFDGSEATEGTAVGSLDAGEWFYQDSKLYVRLSDSTDPSTKDSGFIKFKRVDTGSTPLFISSARFNEADSWYDDDSESATYQEWINPDISQGQVSFWLSANTVEYYERISSDAKKEITAEIQFYQSGEQTDIKKIDIICRNRLVEDLSLELSGENYYTKAEALSLFLQQDLSSLPSATTANDEDLLLLRQGGVNKFSDVITILNRAIEKTKESITSAEETESLTAASPKILAISSSLDFVTTTVAQIKSYIDAYTKSEADDRYVKQDFSGYDEKISITGTDPLITDGAEKITLDNVSDYTMENLSSYLEQLSNIGTIAGTEKATLQNEAGTLLRATINEIKDYIITKVDEIYAKKSLSDYAEETAFNSGFNIGIQTESEYKYADIYNLINFLQDNFTTANLSKSGLMSADQVAQLNAAPSGTDPVIFDSTDDVIAPTDGNEDKPLVLNKNIDETETGQSNNAEIIAHFNGTDEATSYTEKSKNSLTTTFGGNAALSTDDSKFGTASAEIPDANSRDYIEYSQALVPITEKGYFRMWFHTNMTTDSQNHKLVLDINDLDNYFILVIRRQADSGIDFICNGKQASVQVISDYEMEDVPFNNNDWNELVISNDETNLYFYLNGTRVGQITNPYTTGIGSASCFLGGASVASGASGDYFNGYIDEVVSEVGSSVTVPTGATTTVQTEEFPDYVANIIGDISGGLVMYLKSPPTIPPTNGIALYPKNDAGTIKLYVMNSAGTETLLG